MNFQKLADYLDSLNETYGVPATSCRITRDHEEIFRHYTGFMDRENTVPVTDDTLFRLFSATKVVTMTAVMQLIEQGKIGLYDKITRYIPEFSFVKIADEFQFGQSPIRWPKQDVHCHLAHNSIRIIDLMTMTAGLSYNMSAEPLMELREKSNNTAGTVDVVKAMAKVPLIAEPRTRWSYSFAHDVLAAVVEIVSGEKYSEYLRSHIFGPLGNENFYFHPDEETGKRLAAIYRAEIFTEKILDCPPEMAESYSITKNFESGGAGLIATVDAYSNVIDTLSCGGVGKNGSRILSEESIKLMGTNYTTGQMQQDFIDYGKPGYGYGLGVRVLIDKDKSESPLGEFGWDTAAGGYVLVDPVNHLSIFYVQHVMVHMSAYSKIHPMIRDLTYRCMDL